MLKIPRPPARELNLKIILTLVLLLVGPGAFSQQEELTEREKYLLKFAKDPRAVVKPKATPTPLPGPTPKAKTIPSDPIEQQLNAFRTQVPGIEMLEKIDPETQKRLFRAIENKDFASAMKIAKELEDQGNIKIDTLNGTGGAMQMDHKALKQLAIGLGKTWSTRSKAEVKAEIAEMARGTPFTNLLRIESKSNEFVVQFLRSDEAIPGLVDFLKDRRKLIVFGVLNLLSILLAIMIKRYQKRDGQGAVEIIGNWFGRSVFIYGLRIGLLVLFFGTELKPVWEIFTRVYFES